MQRLTLDERVEHFKAAFPDCSASWPWLVQEGGRPVFYARWLSGQDYRNKTSYYGAFPGGFLKKLMALFPDIDAQHVLHAFSGSLPKGEYTRIDCNPSVAPDIVGNVYDAAALVGPRRFRLAIADPPYTPADAKHYGTSGVNRRLATRALADVVVPRGFLAWLDCCWPMHVKEQWRTVGRITVLRSTNHRLRELTIFERVGAARVLEPAAQVERVILRGCRAGQHGPIVEGEPIDHGECVNVDQICSDCSMVVAVKSWTTEAWLKRTR